MNSSHTRSDSVDYGGGGRDVLLIPGLGDELTVWSSAIEALQGRGFRPVAMDAPGIGSDEPSEWSWNEVFAGIDRVISHHDLVDPILMGHSMGGMTAVLYSAQHGSTSLVVNIDGLGVPSPAEMAALPEDERHAMTEAVAMLAAAAEAMNSPEIAPVGALYLGTDLNACYRQATGPILVVLAERDLPGLPEEVAASMRLIHAYMTTQLHAAAGPNTHIATLPTAHYMHVEAPEALADRLRAEVDAFDDLNTRG